MKKNEFNTSVSRLCCRFPYYSVASNLYITSDMIINLCQNILNCSYFFILHDKDLNNQNELKTAHYHLCIIFKDCSKLSPKGFISLFKEYIDILMPDNLIEVKRIYNERASIRYLIHLDNQDKFKYWVADIFTNNNQLLNIYINADTMLDYLIYCIKASNGNYIDLIRLIGIEFYNKYRYIINDIWKECKNIDYKRLYENKESYNENKVNK